MLVCHPYFTRMYSHVICMSLVCTRMSFVCHSNPIRMSLVCHPYVTRMYSYVILTSLVCIRMSFACTCMSSVCHSYVIRMSLVCHPYVTRMYSYVIRMYSYFIRISFLCTRMSLVFGFTMNQCNAVNIDTHAKFFKNTCACQGVRNAFRKMKRMY